MSEFKVVQNELDLISNKYRDAVSQVSTAKRWPGMVNMYLNITKQSSVDISTIKHNLNYSYNEITALYNDLIILRNGIEAVKTESDEADKNAKRVFKPFAFNRFIRNLIDRLKEILDDDHSLVTRVNDIISKLKGWSEQDEDDNQVNYGPAKVEPIILVLNNPHTSDAGTNQEIEYVTTEDVKPNPTVHEEKGYAYNDENGITHLVIPGIGNIALNEYPEGSKYPNSYSVIIDGKQVYLSGGQCLGFARYVHEKIYGEHNIRHENNNFERKELSIHGGQLTAEKAKELITAGGVGAHIRTYNKDGYSDGDNNRWGHSQVVTEITEDGFTIIDANSDGNGTVRIKHYTWEEYVTTGFGKNGIYYIENKK